MVRIRVGLGFYWSFNVTDIRTVLWLGCGWVMPVFYPAFH